MGTVGFVGLFATIEGSNGKTPVLIIGVGIVYAILFSQPYSILQLVNLLDREDVSNMVINFLKFKLFLAKTVFIFTVLSKKKKYKTNFLNSKSI